MNYITDFDGVWTNQGPEAAAVRTLFLEQLGAIAESADLPLVGLLADVQDRIEATPAAYGWAPGGRITAYVDEDPLLWTSAVAMVLEGAGSETDLGRLARAVCAQGFEQVGAFANQCFLQATKAFLERGEPLLVDGAAAIAGDLQAAGVCLIVVSNSSTEKIEHAFAGVGLEPGPQLQIRGGAKKYELGSGEESLELAGRKIWVDRPRYAALLREVQPALVIGDVFSLDLALPHSLRSRGELKGPPELVLRRHPHTPAWVLEGPAQGLFDRTVQSLRELVPGPA